MSVSHASSASHISKLIDAYLDGPVQVRRMVSDLSVEQLKARPLPGRWSTLEVVCHLVDSEQAWCHRMKRVIAEDRPLIIGYDETRFTQALEYHEHDLEEELQLLETMRTQLARVLRGLGSEAWSRTCVHSERGLMTLEEMLQTETDHIPHHIQHIVQKRDALGLRTNSH
jgi:uncharacterized damage-inducible protein DinB